MTTTVSTVNERFETALAALAAVRHVTLADIEAVADRLSLDEIELANEVTERRAREHGDESERLRAVLAAVSEHADGYPDLDDDAERLANIRRIVRTYEGDVLGIVTAPIDQPGPAVAS